MLSTEKKIDKIYQVVVGLEDNPHDNGLIGDVQEIKEHLKTLNGDVSKNTTARKTAIWAGTTITTMLSGGIVAIIVLIIQHMGK